VNKKGVVKFKEQYESAYFWLADFSKGIGLSVGYYCFSLKYVYGSDFFDSPLVSGFNNNFTQIYVPVRCLRNQE
jgi:hypothetical protein